MTGNKLFYAFALSVGLLLTGCGSSPPNNYYLLSPHSFSPADENTPTVGVGPIETPEYLSRENLVFNSAENSLEVSSENMWAEPLNDGIQRVLVLNLAGLLKTQSVVYFPWHRKRAPDYGVKVNLLQLDANAQEAVLTAEWLVYRPTSSESVNRRISRLQLPLTPGIPPAKQVAQAYSELLFQLSEIISREIAADASKRSEITE